MPRHNIIETSPYNCQQLYDLVINIEQYPTFIPWCKAARILQQYDDYFEAELMISFKHIRESYVSKVQGNPQNYTIKVEMLRGPFHHLVNEWRFEAMAEGGCKIFFHIDFAFKNIILEKIIGALFNKATQKMVAAFKQQAQVLYSKN
jgi:coenzyme Q-binding protein COQ10